MQRYFEVNEGGHNIRCKLYFRDLKDIRKVVIFTHGFGGHKDNGAAEKFAERLTSKYKGTAMVTFNWPCHGDDVKKVLRLEDCMTYLELVVGHVTEKYDPEALFCYGTSFGGWLTLKYLHDRGNPFRRIALRCPAIPMYEAFTKDIVTPEELSRLEKGKDVLVGFDRKVPVTQAFLREVEANDVRKWDFLDYAEDIFILHGTADEIIPFEDSRVFADEQLMEFLPIPGADHRFRSQATMETAMKAMLEWFGF